MGGWEVLLSRFKLIFETFHQSVPCAWFLENQLGIASHGTQHSLLVLPLVYFPPPLRAILGLHSDGGERS